MMKAYWATCPSVDDEWGIFIHGETPNEAKSRAKRCEPSGEWDEWHDTAEADFITAHYPAFPVDLDVAAKDQDGNFYGWVSPSGEFYPCEYEDHEGVPA